MFCNRFLGIQISKLGLLSFLTVACLLVLTLGCSDEAKPSKKITETTQDANTILGDKIILSDTIDENGLKSPDTILVLENQKLTDRRFPILNTKNYFFDNQQPAKITFTKKLSDSIHFADHKKVVIYKVRPNNFEDDTSLTAEQCFKSYRNYKVKWFNKKDRVLLISPKKTYLYARNFLRFIKFDSNGRQIKSLTLQDYSLFKGYSNKSTYFLGICLNEHGASSFFTNINVSNKIVMMDKDLRILNEIVMNDRGTLMCSFKKHKSQFFADFEMHFGCEICKDRMGWFTLVINEKCQPIEIIVTKSPEDDPPLIPENLMKMFTYKKY